MGFGIREDRERSRGRRPLLFLSIPGFPAGTYLIKIMAG
jgi:hypothetical protein